MTHPIDKKLDKKGRLQIFLKGIAMGCADIIPGVSGGTIAFMFGIYEDFILSIKSFDTNFVKYLLKGEFRSGASHVAWNFLLCVVGGIAAAIIALSSIISWLLTHEPILINSFFFRFNTGDCSHYCPHNEKMDIFKILLDCCFYSLDI